MLKSTYITLIFEFLTANTIFFQKLISNSLIYFTIVMLLTYYFNLLEGFLAQVSIHSGINLDRMGSIFRLFTVLAIQTFKLNFN